MDQIDKAACRQISSEALTALQTVADAHGLTVAYEGGRFDPNVGTYTPKFTFSLAGAAQASWDRSCRLIGLLPEDFEQVVTVNGSQFKLTSINLRASKFPVEAVKVSDGKGYKFPERVIVSALGRTPAPELRVLEH